VQWKIKNLGDQKISKKYSGDTNDVIIEESQNIKKRWQNLKGTTKMAATKILGNSNNTARKEMNYIGNSQHDRGMKGIQEFEQYRWTGKIQSTDEPNH